MFGFVFAGGAMLVSMPTPGLATMSAGVALFRPASPVVPPVKAVGLTE